MVLIYRNSRGLESCESEWSNKQRGQNQWPRIYSTTGEVPVVQLFSLRPQSSLFRCYVTPARFDDQLALRFFDVIRQADLQLPDGPVTLFVGRDEGETIARA